MDKIIQLLQQTSVTHPIYNQHKYGIVSVLKQVATLLNNNPQIFNHSGILPPKNAETQGPLK